LPRWSRPINNIVDITNYILLLVGHPVHAFDGEKLDERPSLSGGSRRQTVAIGTARCAIDPEMLAICDASAGGRRRRHGRSGF
jgi:phenylalanyl-tRNA synthetase beta chain